MGLLELLGVVALLAVFWFAHPIWLGWGWPSVSVRVREVWKPELARLHVFLVPVTIEIREADGRLSAHDVRVFGGSESRLARGASLTLRRNPQDHAEFADAAGGWRLMGECALVAVGLVVFVVLVVLDG